MTKRPALLCEHNYGWQRFKRGNTFTNFNKETSNKNMAGTKRKKQATWIIFCPWIHIGNNKINIEFK